MKMIQCEKAGHFYDADVNSACPYCNTSNEATITPPPSPGNSSNVGRTVAVSPAAANNDGRTVAVFKAKTGIDPVVGWLVCIEGADKGQDYRIHSDNNFIGRDNRMDISIKGDDTVSRENHAIISYDSKEKVYYFSPGDGRAIVRHNGNAIFSTVKIQSHDIVEIGNTKLAFIPLCSDKFDWE